MIWAAVVAAVFVPVVALGVLFQWALSHLFEMTWGG